MKRVGHRGAMAYEPENTIRSWRKAIAFGVDVIDSDARLSKDGKVVMIHDKALDRTTNGKGLVKDFTLTELRKLNAGKGEKIPTLKEFLKLAKENNVIAQIELKERGMEEKVVKEIENLGMIDKTIIISFNGESIRKVKEINPLIQTGLIFANKIKNLTKFFRYCKVLKADWLYGAYNAVDANFIKSAHKWGFKFLVWVLNDVESIKKFAGFGCDAIASDKPDLFKKLKFSNC